MSRGEELIKNTAIVALGKVCTKMWTFILLPFYTTVLSTEEYGTVELLNTFVSLLLPMVAFQISDALFRFMVDARRKEEEKKEIISTILIFFVFQSVIFSVLFGIVGIFVMIPFGRFLYLNVIVNIFSGALLQLCRGMGDNVGYAIASFLTAGSVAVFNILFVLVLRYGAEGMLSAMFLSQCISVLYIIWKERVFQFVRFRYFRYELLKEMLIYSVPLIPNYLCWWILGASDKAVVSYFIGIAENGILSVSQKFSIAYTTVYNVFNLTWTENASIHKDDADREKYYSRVIESAFRLLSSGCLAAIAIVGVAFPVLINNKFSTSYYQIPIYLLSAFIHSVIGIFSVVYIALKKTKEIAKTSMYAAVINLAVNICLIRYIGLFAASLSSVIAYAVLLGIRYFDIQKYMKIKLKKKDVCSFVVALLFVFTMYYIRKLWAGVLNLLIATFYVVFMNKKIVRGIKELLYRKLVGR